MLTLFNLQRLAYSFAFAVLLTNSSAAQDATVEEIYAQIQQIQNETDELKVLLIDQNALLALASTNPEAAQKALKPYVECLKSLIVAYCPIVRMNFQPSDRSVLKRRPQHNSSFGDFGKFGHCFHW